MDTREDVDTLDETILDHAPQCGFNHRHRGFSCTEHVTHRVVSCDRAPLLCESATSWVRTQLWAPGVRCVCGRSAAECWNLWPA